MQKRVIQSFALAIFLLLLTAMAPLSSSAAHVAQISTGNPYAPAYQHSYRHGAVPTVTQLNLMRAYQHAHPNIAAASANTLSFGGGIDGIGVTSGTEKVYLVFFGTQWGTQSTDSGGNLTFSSDTSGAAPYLQKLFKGIGTGSELWSGTMTQYCDGSGVSVGATSCPAGAAHVGYPTGGALTGVWYDNAAAEPQTASGHQLAVEAINAAGHFGNTTAASNRFAQYVILSATGTNPDNWLTGGFCAWHDYNGDTTLSGGAASSSFGDIAFTNMPYVLNQGTSCGQNFVNGGSAGTLDGFSIVNGHEYSETVTDQNPAGGWTSASTGEENADECAWISSGQGASANVTMGNGTYAMQSSWSNDTNECDLSHSIVTGGGGGGTGITNGGFETGSFTGWTRSGTTSISTTAHSGSFSALVGSTSPTNGSSSVAQTFTAPSGTSTLTFWYLVNCPDTLQFDWATATLKDNTTGVTTTALPKTCNTNNTWVRVTASVTAGHSYTLTLTSHDDNFAGDPTFTLYDDVAVN